MSGTITCEHCGCALSTRTLKTLNGKKYCASCYDKIARQLEDQDQQIGELLDYARQLFGLSEIPLEWRSRIDAFMKSGKKPFGMRYCLYYYYVVLGNKCTDLNYALYPINTHYTAAQKYYEEQQEIYARNQQFQDDHKTVNYTIKRQASGYKPKYKIEDL